MTTTVYPNTAAGYAQAVADHGEANLLVDPFAHTITVKPAEAAPADRYVTAEQFRDRFTEAELMAIFSASVGLSSPHRTSSSGWAITSTAAPAASSTVIPEQSMVDWS